MALRWLGRLLGLGEGGRRPPLDFTQRRGPKPAGIIAAGGTDRGRERENNEDGYFCDAERGAFVVADGMGGHAAGEQASRIAVDALTRALLSRFVDEFLGREGTLENLFLEALKMASEELLAAWHENPQWWGMDSTAVMGVYRDGRMYVANLGDSRAYLIRGGRWAQLTRDHSIAAVLAEQGQISPKEARSHDSRNKLTRSLGQTPIEPHYAVAELEAGDRVVFCTDGLWDMLPDDVIAEVVMAYESPEEAVGELINLANEAGGYDNITVIVVKCLGEPGAEVDYGKEPITAVTFEEAPGAPEGQGKEELGSIDTGEERVAEAEEA
jgi:protein phosphatase